MVVVGVSDRRLAELPGSSSSSSVRPPMDAAWLEAGDCGGLTDTCLSSTPVSRSRHRNRLQGIVAGEGAPFPFAGDAGTLTPPRRRGPPRAGEGATRGPPPQSDAPARGSTSPGGPPPPTPRRGRVV